MAHSFHGQKPSEVQSTEATINSAILQHCNSLLHIQALPLPYPWRTLTIGASEAYRTVTTEFLTSSFTLLLIDTSISQLIMEKNCESGSAW